MDLTDEAQSPANHLAIAELLIGCARANLDAAQLDRVRDTVTANQFDWNALLQVATEHGVIPLLHRAITRACDDLIPESIKQTLNRQAQANAQNNLLLMRELLKLLSEMDAVGVHVLPYKGPLLAMGSYGDLSLRQCGDLDILVPHIDVPAARSILEKCGYAPTKPMDAKEEAEYESSPHEYDYAYVRQNPSAMVELHWKVVGRFFSFDPDPMELWNRATVQSIAGTKVRVLQPEDLLLILCAHGTKHFWSRLTWICDIAQFLKHHSSLDWKIVLERSEKYDAKGMLLLGLLLAEGVLGVQLPDAVKTEIAPSNRKQAAELQNRLFLQGAQPDDQPKGARMQLTEGGLFQSLLFQFRMRDRWSSGVRYCFYRAFAPNAVDRSWIKLPRALGFGYYLMRPLRLFVKYSLKPLTRLLPSQTPPAEQTAAQH